MKISYIVLAMLAAIILASLALPALTVAPASAGSPVTVKVTAPLKFGRCKVVAKEVTSTLGTVTLDKEHKTGKLALDLDVDRHVTMRVFCDGAYLVTYWPEVEVKNGWLALP